MDPLTAIMIGGTIMNIAGQYEANLAQAKREFMNARYYQEQASLIQLAGARRSYIAKREYSSKFGQQISAAAGSGVDISGSVANTISQTLSDQVLELEAIRKDTEIQKKMALLRSQEASDTGQVLSSGRYNLTQAAGTILTSAAQTRGFGTIDSNGSFRGFGGSDSASAGSTSGSGNQASYFPIDYRYQTGTSLRGNV